jgi:hypothetical protein
MTQRSKMRPARLGLSLVSMIAGWCAGLVFYALFALTSNALGWRGDLLSIAGWTAIFTLAGWLVFFVPLIWFTQPTSQIYRAQVFPWLGGVLGIAAFAVLVAWWAPLWKHWLYAVYPAVVGGASACTFSWLQQKLVR